MNQRILAAVAAAFLALVIIVALVLRSRPEAVPVGRTEAPAAAPATPSAPTPTPTPAPEPARPTARRVAPAPEAPPAEAPVESVAEVGTLRIESDVPGAQVFIDRQFIGATPVTAENVKPGSHQLNVSAEGFDGFANTIDVAPGSRDIMVRFREVQLDAKVDVIHKHRVGSCTGQLVASPQGLRYETANKDDAFVMPLPDLDTFQVDYLDKNLKVKSRKGRQFNFTDPDGNADKLFVFQRDVERARDRLRKGDQASQ